MRSSCSDNFTTESFDGIFNFGDGLRENLHRNHSFHHSVSSSVDSLHPTRADLFQDESELLCFALPEFGHLKWGQLLRFDELASYGFNIGGLYRRYCW